MGTVTNNLYHVGFDTGLTDSGTWRLDEFSVMSTEMSDEDGVDFGNRIIPFTSIATVSAPTTTYVDSSMGALESKCFKVTATNSVGESSASTISCGTSLNPVASVPTGLALTSDSTTQITIDWDNAPSVDNITGFRIFEESPSGNGWTKLVNDTSSSTSNYIHSSLTTDTQHNYMLAGINATGISANSTAVSTYTLLNAPTSLLASAISDTSIALSWTAPSGSPTGYRIQQDAVTIFNDTSTTDVTKTITGLTTATSYDFELFAWNLGGVSLGSGTTSGSTEGILSAPTIDTITRLSPTSLKLDFTTGAGLPLANGYKIERQTGSGWTLVTGNTTTTDVTYSDSGLPSDQSTTYRLYAHNTYGTSLASSEKTSDVIASSGGGGGSGSTAVLSRTSLSELVDLTFIDQIHRVVLGQFLSKSINVAWDSSDNLEIKSIVVSDSPIRIVFQDVPFVLFGDPSGISNGKISYSVQIPTELCTTQGQINCVEKKQYDIPVEIQSKLKGTTLTKSSVIKIDLASGSDIPLVFVLLAISAVPVAIILRRVTGRKTKRSSRRKASGSSHKSSKNGSNAKKISL